MVLSSKMLQQLEEPPTVFLEVFIVLTVNGAHLSSRTTFSEEWFREKLSKSVQGTRKTIRYFRVGTEKIVGVLRVGICV